MKWVRRAALVVLVAVFGISLFVDVIAPQPYARQNREVAGEPPSADYPLGTDDLGRDRLSRLLYGARISLLLALAAAALSVSIAAGIGITAGAAGGRVERWLMQATDLFLSLPWLFLLLAVRALLPLNVSPHTSVAITFALLGCLGWAASARVMRAGVRALSDSAFALQARACGCSRTRLFLVHMLPNLRPVLLAQFWISLPVFVLAEANLGMLGLGVAEPLPSWGTLLRELENLPAVTDSPWLLAPAALLVLVVSCLQLSFCREGVST